MMKKTISIVTFIVIATASTSLFAQDNIVINRPDVAFANVYAIDQGKSMSSAETTQRAEMFAESFGVPAVDINHSEIRGKQNEMLGIIYGDTPRWTYGYFPMSGFEDFVDLKRFLMADPADKTPLIDEFEAKAIALDFIKNHFEDSELAEIREVRFSRVWDVVYLTPDEKEPIIQKTSNEAVVKVLRSIDGLPVMGHGGFRIHIANDGTVVGAFRRCRNVDYVPVDSVELPTMEELKEIANETMWKYCGDGEGCKLKVDVGYFEGNASIVQELLEPVIVVRLSQHSKGGDSVARRFTIPIRDASIAENIAPEDEDE